jgi:hypothetical protein
MSLEPSQAIKYVIGALLIIAGAALFVVQQPTYAFPLIALGLGILGYGAGLQAGYKRGVAVKKP